MSNRKRGSHRGNGFYFKGNRIVLESAKSKIVFFVIVLMFGVVCLLED